MVFDDAAWIAALRGHLPRLSTTKQAHVLSAINFMQLLVHGDVEAMYRTLSRDVRDRYSKDEYAAAADELFVIYSGLSPAAQAVFRAATIFHDIGALPGSRSWLHDERGAEEVAALMKTGRDTEEFIARVAFAVRHHSLPGNVGVDYLPRDLPCYSGDSLDILRLLGAYDLSGRTGGNNLGPEKLRALLAATRLQETPPAYFEERLGRGLTPLSLADPYETAAQWRALKPELMSRGYLTPSFENDYNTRIRTYAFDVFRRTARRSAALAAELFYRISKAANLPGNAQAPDVIVDTDVDLMALPDSEAREPFIERLAVELERKSLPCKTNRQGNVLWVVMQLGAPA